MLVKKRGGTHRFCVDYQKLNAVTRKDAYPIPRIDDTLDTLSRAAWFSTLDMVSGYWQVEVGEKDREKKTPFVPHTGCMNLSLCHLDYVMGLLFFRG